MPRSTQQSAQKPLKTASEKQPVKKEDAAAVPEPSPLIPRPEEQPKASAAEVVPGEVLNEILPDVSQKARDTIRGRVRVRVKVHVDSSGDLAGAELDSPGPSKYFAGLALQATPVGVCPGEGGRQQRFDRLGRALRVFATRYESLSRANLATLGRGDTAVCAPV